MNRRYTTANFSRAEFEPGQFAYTYADDANRIYLDYRFWEAPVTGRDSRAGTLVHEMSHFDHVGRTQDYAYDQASCRRLAARNPHRALRNADNFEYYLEIGR